MPFSAGESVRIFFKFTKAGEFVDVLMFLLSGKPLPRPRRFSLSRRKTLPSSPSVYRHYGFWRSMGIAARHRRDRRQFW